MKKILELDQLSINKKLGLLNSKEQVKSSNTNIDFYSVFITSQNPNSSVNLNSQSNNATLNNLSSKIKKKENIICNNFKKIKNSKK